MSSAAWSASGSPKTSNCRGVERVRQDADGDARAVDAARQAVDALLLDALARHGAHVRAGPDGLHHGADAGRGRDRRDLVERDEAGEQSGAVLRVPGDGLQAEALETLLRVREAGARREADVDEHTPERVPDREPVLDQPRAGAEPRARGRRRRHEARQAVPEVPRQGLLRPRRARRAEGDQAHADADHRPATTPRARRHAHPSQDLHRGTPTRRWTRAILFLASRRVKRAGPAA